MKRHLAATVWRALLALAALLSVASSAHAHQIDAASLSLREVSPGVFQMTWRASSPSLQQDLSRPAVFPDGCKLDGQYLDCGDHGLHGRIAFPWLEGTLTHVMVDIEWQGQPRLLRTVTASSPSLLVDGAATSGFAFVWPIAVDYVALGVEHILTGFDHLLFVVALTLLVRQKRALVVTVTAFTLAHSLSLAATVLGLVNVPSPPVEASIALSIVLVCAECLRPSGSLAQRAPWLVAFAFGLLHGLGFASALLEIGLPERHVPLALLFFNAGVELGQLGVIAVVTGAGLGVARLGLRRAWLRPSVIYAMGTLAACWTIERVATIFGG
jgi:hydrogenase/urease accessory protein HupE